MLYGAPFQDDNNSLFLYDFKGGENARFVVYSFDMMDVFIVGSFKGFIESSNIIEKFKFIHKLYFYKKKFMFL